MRRRLHHLSRAGVLALGAITLFSLYHSKIARATYHVAREHYAARLWPVLLVLGALRATRLRWRAGRDVALAFLLPFVAAAVHTAFAGRVPDLELVSQLLQQATCAGLTAAAMVALQRRAVATSTS